MVEYEIPYCKVICKGCARGDGALNHTSRAIHVCASVHVEAMEMQRCGLITQAVVGVDDDPITNIDLDKRDGPLAVDSNNCTLIGTVGVSSDPADVEVIFPRGSGSQLRERKQRGCRVGEGVEEHCEGMEGNASYLELINTHTGKRVSRMGWREEEDEEEISSRMQLLELAKAAQDGVPQFFRSGSGLEVINVQSGRE